MAKLSSLVVDLQVESAALRKGLDQANAQLKVFGDKVSNVAKGMAVAFTAKYAKDALVALGDFTMHGLEMADAMGKLAQSTGIGVEALSGLSYAAKLSDIGAEELRGALGHLNKDLAAAAGGGREQAAVFRALGIATKDAGGQIRPTGDVVADVAEKFSRMEDGAGKAALAQQLFGKSGARLIPMLNAGRDGLAEMTKEAEDLGVVVSEQTARAAEEFNDNLTKLQTVADGLSLQLAATLAPALATVTDNLVTFIRESGVVKTLGSAMETGFRGVLLLVSTIAGAFELMVIRIETLIGAALAFKAGGMDMAALAMRVGAARSVDADQRMVDRTRDIINTDPMQGPEFRRGQTGGGEAPVVAKRAGKFVTALADAFDNIDAQLKYEAEERERANAGLAESTQVFDQWMTNFAMAFADAVPLMEQERQAKAAMQAGFADDARDQIIGGLGDAGSIIVGLATGDFVGALTQLLMMSEQWATLVDTLNMILEPVANVLGTMLQPLLAPLQVAASFVQAIAPALEVFVRMGMLMAQPLFILAQVALPLLQSGLTVVANVMTAIAEAIANVWNGIVEIIIGILRSVADVLGPLGGAVDLLADGVNGMRITTFHETEEIEDNTKAREKESARINDVTESISNVPQWFKTTAARYSADMGIGGGPTVIVTIDGQQVAAKVQKTMASNLGISTGTYIAPQKISVFGRIGY